MTKHTSIWPLLAITLLLLMQGCAPTYKRSFTTAQAIPNMNITLETVQSTPFLYEVKVQNGSSTPAKLLWDESTYTTTGGTSYRLIRGNTRRLYSGHTQPNTPIPADGRIAEKFTAECWTEALSLGVYGHMTIESIDDHAVFRFVFERDGQKLTWTENVKFSKPGTEP